MRPTDRIADHARAAPSMTTSPDIRPFRDADYPRIVAIANASFPAAPRALDDVRRRDALWDHNRFALARIVAEIGGDVVGWGQLNHLPHQFAPDRYRIGIQVDPAWRRRGIGGRLLDALLADLRERGAALVSARASADLPDALAFLAHRGFVPVEETWEATMPVAMFDPQRSLDAEARLARDGIAITALADECADDPAVLERVYRLYLACLDDIPTAGATTRIPYAQFVAREIAAPNALPDACFLAVAGGEYVGLCIFVRDPGQPAALAGRMTGCLPAWRGRGITTALKLRMARYAREHGFTTIRTWNSAANASMRHINEAIGFAQETIWVTYHRHLDEEGAR
jgi:GNAT superfamily N-acetyltransferase